MQKQLSIFVLFACTLGIAEEPPPAQESPEADARQIEQWIKDLGNNSFTERQAAIAKLKTAGEAAIAPLQKASVSEDLEVRVLATELLPTVRALAGQLRFERAIKEHWMKALGEGRITGPTLGSLEGDSGHDQQETNQETAERHELIAEAGKISATDAALRWLARTQEEDGHWDSCKWGATSPADIEQTALALFAFLAAGHSEKAGDYNVKVKQAVAWLCSRQNLAGAIVPLGWEKPDTLAHAVAGLALAETVSMNGYGYVRETAQAGQRAVDYTTQFLQAVPGGGVHGIGRLPQSDQADLVTSAFFAMQLKSAKVANLNVKRKAFENVTWFLDVVDSQDRKDGGFFSYVPGGQASAEATLFGCLARQVLGTNKNELATQVTKSAKAFKGPTTGQADSNLLANYFGTLVAFKRGGTLWKDWNEGMQKSLLDAQHREGDLDGSWDPSGKWSSAGRVFATAINTLCLEVQLDKLPMYKK